MRFLVAASSLSLVFACSAQAQPARAPAEADYSKAANWLCLPDRKDVCSTPLATTALNPNGYGSTGPSPVAKNPPLDCFYVYPTVSGDRGLNSDLIPDASERLAAQSQFARFAGVCRTFAPLYRQLTTGAIAAAATGADIGPPRNLAYRDVLAAFRNYLASRSSGRPFVLVGHSQGSWHLQRLIAEEIEGKPIARRMRLAIIPGFNLLVPQGRLVGGTLKSTPLCSRPAETGCVISYVSYRERNMPPEGALFGFAPPGMTVGCVNPARPGSRGWERLDSYWYGRTNQPAPGGPIVWSSSGAPPTPYLRTEGLVSGRCVNDGRRGYLSIRTNADPKDSRTDRVGGEVGILGFFIPGWGMHLADIPAAQGDLIRAVEDIARNEAARRP
jgi:hypothetical protein